MSVLYSNSALQHRPGVEGGRRDWGKKTMPGLPTCPGIVHDVRTWLPIVNDVRTALVKDPLPIETVKDLLGAA